MDTRTRHSVMLYQHCLITAEGLVVCVAMNGTVLGAGLAEDNSQLLQSVGNGALTDGVLNVAGSESVYRQRYE